MANLQTRPAYLDPAFASAVTYVIFITMELILLLRWPIHVWSHVVVHRAAIGAVATVARCVQRGRGPATSQAHISLYWLHSISVRMSTTSPLVVLGAICIQHFFSRSSCFLFIGSQTSIKGFSCWVYHFVFTYRLAVITATIYKKKYPR